MVRVFLCRALRSKVLCLLGTVLCLGMFAVLPVDAEEEESEALTMPPAYAEVEEALPEDVRDLLPDGLFSSSAEEALSAAEAATDWQYLLDACLSAVGLRLSDAVGLFASLVGFLLIAAVLARLRESLSGRSGDMFGFCVRLLLCAAIVTRSADMVAGACRFFDSLGALTRSMIPSMGTLYALGGNLGEAAIQEELLMVFLAVSQYVGTSVTPPVCALCLSLSLMDALGTRLTLAPFCDRIKKWYASLLGFVFFLLGLALSAQSVLAARADSLGMRGVKYAVGNWIPVVGGALAGTLGTVAESVGLLRGVCGISGVIAVALLLLPTLVELLLFRAILQLGAMVASLVGCEGEGRLLAEMASLHGYLAAAVSMASLMFILSLSLLIHSGVALS